KVHGQRLICAAGIYRADGPDITVRNRHRRPEGRVGELRNDVEAGCAASHRVGRSMMPGVAPFNHGRSVEMNFVVLMRQHHPENRPDYRAKELARFQLINSRDVPLPDRSFGSHDGFPLTRSSEAPTRGSHGTTRNLTLELISKPPSDDCSEG